MRPLLLKPSVELPMGRDPCKGCAEFGRGDVMRTFSLGPWVEPPLGHDPCLGCADLDGADRYLLSGAAG